MITVAPGTPLVRRCLPVVVAGCGCVYSCGLGTEEATGGWKVAHEAWPSHPISATIDRWCVDGQCTEAFFGEILCSVKCAPSGRCRGPTRCETGSTLGVREALEPYQGAARIPA